uniref:Uncharacterized protein n=1 Tax=Anguilla anguilla TaxID=7936 RepID=A0A0E9XBA2_ANGAN
MKETREMVLRHQKTISLPSIMCVCFINEFELMNCVICIFNRFISSVTSQPCECVFYITHSDNGSLSSDRLKSSV